MDRAPEANLYWAKPQARRRIVMLLKDRVALITGAGRGIGQGIALRFAQEGAKLALTDIEAG